MYRLTITLMLLLLVSSPSLAAEIQEPDDESSQAAETDDGQTSSAEDEISEEEEASPTFIAVEDYTWEFGAGFGRTFWENNYGSYLTLPLVVLHGRYRLADPLSISLTAQHSSRTTETTPFSFTNRRLGATAGLGVHQWLEWLVVGADLEAGGFYERRTLTDTVGTSSDGRLRPLASLSGRAGVAFFSTAVISLQSGILAHPDGIDPTFELSFSWLL